MIIGKASGIQTLERLLGQLANTQRSVVRVAIGSGRQAFCSGFFILRDLIAVPAFIFLDPEPAASAECFRNGKRVWQQQIRDIELLHAAPDMPPLKIAGLGSGPLIALLRVKTTRKTERDMSLDLGFDAPEPGAFVAVVQFARGEHEHSVSFGTVKFSSDTILSHDADTDHGSGGSPVFDASWRVIGMHFAADQSNRVNQAITRAAMIGALRQSASWDAIKERHRIADVAAAKGEVAAETVMSVEPERPSPVLLRAALAAGVVKGSLDEKDAALLRPYVVDANADRWVLRPGERARIIRAGGSLAELRKTALPSPDRASDPMQRVIDRILQGPPFDLHAEDDESLAWWIQATRWFAGVHPELPTPAGVTRVLERRRVRGRLETIAGKDFRGRTSELASLAKWWKDSAKPLSLTGIGGIGKSALIARFASKLPEETLLLWLDFDRADLAPDNAPSILSAMAAQAAVQLEDFQPPRIKVEGWETSATELGERLHESLPPHGAALLVLDSFEAAQYAKHYQELWPVLELIATAFPALRLVVTGRAPVQELTLRGEKAEPIHLRGLAPDDARKWLRDHKVTDPVVLEHVLTLSDGIPLILRLALRFIEKGGKISELPEKLPAEIVAGFLYDRILDRVQNPIFKPIATAALVLRRLTADMVEPVLRGLVDLPPGEVSDWFPELAREMALVEGTEVLRLRAEVRTPALELLERDQPALARSVEERIENWYATPEKMADPEMAAELVYHRLRLGDEAGADQAWRADSRKYLLDVAEDMRPAGLLWLQAHGVGNAPADSSEAAKGWEVETAERIRSARSRGHDRVVKSILSERGERSDASPLVFHDAFECWAEGDKAGAAQILADAGEAPGPTGRDRALLRALLLAESGDRHAAREVLVGLEGEEQWSDRRAPSMYALAIRAARIDLALDLDRECELIAQGPESVHDSALSPTHVVLPRLSKLLASVSIALESIGIGQRFNVTDPSAIEQLALATVAAHADPNKARGELAKVLTGLGNLRWWLATASSLLPEQYRPTQGAHPELTMPWSFLSKAYEVATHAEPTPFDSAIVGTLAVFTLELESHGAETLQLEGPRGSVAEVVAKSPAIRKNLRIESARWPRALRILREGVDPSRSWENLVRSQVSTRTGKQLMIFTSEVQSLPPEQRGPLIHLMTPRALEQMVREIAGYASEAL